MSTREQLLKDIEAFLAKTGMTATTFGVHICNDRAFMIAMRKGRDVRTGTADRIRKFMADYLKDHPKRRAQARQAA